jgi:competence protein ComEA
MLKKLLLAIVGLVVSIGMAIAAVNINTATEQELDSLPGVGPVKAKAIVEYRKANGNFKSVDDLKNVKGIGDKTFADLKSQIAVSGATTVPAKAEKKETVKEEAKEAKSAAKADTKAAAKATKSEASSAAAAVDKKADKAQDAVKEKAKDAKEDVKADAKAAKSEAKSAASAADAKMDKAKDKAEKKTKKAASSASSAK